MRGFDRKPRGRVARRSARRLGHKVGPKDSAADSQRVGATRHHVRERKAALSRVSVALQCPTSLSIQSGREDPADGLVRDDAGTKPPCCSAVCRTKYEAGRLKTG